MIYEHKYRPIKRSAHSIVCRLLGEETMCINNNNNNRTEHAEIVIKHFKQLQKYRSIFIQFKIIQKQSNEEENKREREKKRKNRMKRTYFRRRSSEELNLY